MTQAMPNVERGMLHKEHFRTAVYPTPFHPRTSQLNVLNEWHRWKDYTTADAYYDAALEYSAIRNACAVFDLCPMTKHRITGPDALAFLNRLVTRDVAKIKAGKVGYTVWCDDNGQVIDDGTIFWQGDETGAPVNGAFANWNSTEPNGFGASDCARLAPSQDNSWADLECEMPRGALCEGPAR